MKALLAIPFALFLGGCATFGTLERDALNVWNVVTSTSISPQAVLVAANSYDALEASATNYLRLKTCSLNSGPVCKDPRAVKAIIPAVRAGRVARNNLEQFLKDHPGQLGPSGLYDALGSSVRSIQAIYAHYQIGS